MFLKAPQNQITIFTSAKIKNGQIDPDEVADFELPHLDSCCLQIQNFFSSGEINVNNLKQYML